MINNESIWDKINSNFAQGGSVNKENHMYADGGFLDDGSSVDPVSGNEVPSGSLAEEVRDDVPAQLSEGEFVVPADVVRYIGLEKLMKMREAAKAGLANMEADGQMGGQPVPMMEDPMMDESMEMDALIDGMDGEGFDGAVQQFAKGGSVRGYDDGGGVELPSYESYVGRKFNSPDIIQQIKYVNAAGEVIYIPTLKGQPLKAIPEGYSIYVESEEGGETTVAPAEGDVVSGGTTNNQAAQDFAQNGGREARDAKIAVSNKIQRTRMNNITSLAGANLSQAGVDALYESLTPQAKDIYNNRFRDPSGPDSFMTEGMSSADLLITAQKTADGLNNRRGVIEADNTSVQESVDWESIKEAGSILAKGLVLSPLGVLTGFLTGSMSEDEKSNATSLLSKFGQLFEDSPYANRDGKVGNTPTETAITKPNLSQAHWVKRMGELASEGLDDAAIQKQLFKEQQETGALYGTDAYGRKLSEDSVNTSVPTATDTLNDIRLAEEKKIRTLKAIVEEKKVQDKAEADQVETQNEMDKLRADAAEKQQLQDKIAARKNEDRLAIEAAAAREAAAAKKAADELASKTRTDRGYTPTNTTNNNDGGNNNNYTYSPPTPSKKEKEEQASDYDKMYGNAGGLATKKKPSVKKMRKDPTSGLAAKKKSKAKAQAKKGALAAKRT